MLTNAYNCLENMYFKSVSGEKENPSIVLYPNSNYIEIHILICGICLSKFMLQFKIHLSICYKLAMVSISARMAKQLLSNTKHSKEANIRGQFSVTHTHTPLV